MGNIIKDVAKEVRAHRRREDAADYLRLHGRRYLDVKGTEHGPWPQIQIGFELLGGKVPVIALRAEGALKLAEEIRVAAERLISEYGKDKV